MKIYSLNSASYTPVQNIKSNFVFNNETKPDTFNGKTGAVKQHVSFGWNPVKEIKEQIKYAKAQIAADNLYRAFNSEQGRKEFLLRTFSMENLEGLQKNIKVFDGLSMKDIQYLSENLHVIAVKRGCNNMCGYCYADAKPQNREMSWEDFTKITRGFKTLKNRMHGLDIFGENNPISQSDVIYRSTELFYDADCMDLAIKDKKGKTYDFIELVSELNDSLGRKTVFDTSGWYRKNPVKQQRAEKYAQYFSNPENMEKLNAFNVSFNTFNASYIASVRAKNKGYLEKSKELRQRFVDNMANTLFTFTPLVENPKFNIMVRAFNNKAKNAKDFNVNAMFSLAEEVLSKLGELYKQDLDGPQKYVKTKEECFEKLNAFMSKMMRIDTELNSSGRMKSFMKEFGIVDKNMLEYDESIKPVKKDLEELGRFHKTMMFRLIDTDGKVYHMNYARFFPTEIQLNISEKDKPSPKLANLDKDFVVTKEMINRPEYVVVKQVKKV